MTNVVIEIFDNGGRGSEWVSKTHQDCTNLKAFLRKKKREFLSMFTDKDDKRDARENWGVDKLADRWILYGEDGGEYFGYARVMTPKQVAAFEESEDSLDEFISSL